MDSYFFERYKTWTILKQSEKEKPTKIAFINFKDYTCNYDYANHYDSLIEKLSQPRII